MRTTLAAQLSRLEHQEAAEQTLAGVWSDLFALFPDTALEDDAEEIGGPSSISSRVPQKRAAQIDRATDQIRLLIASAARGYGHDHDRE